MSEGWRLFTVLMCFMFFIVGVMFGKVELKRSIVKPCEAELPRNQSCKLIAVVKESK